MYIMSIGKHTFVRPFHWTAILFDLTIGPTIFQMSEQLAFQPFTNQWNESIVNYPIFNGRATDPRFFDRLFTKLLDTHWLGYVFEHLVIGKSLLELICKNP